MSMKQKQNIAIGKYEAKVSFTDIGQCPVFQPQVNIKKASLSFCQISNQRWKVQRIHMTSLQQMFPTKESIQAEDEPVFKKWPNHENR